MSKKKRLEKSRRLLAMRKCDRNEQRDCNNNLAVEAVSEEIACNWRMQE